MTEHETKLAGTITAKLNGARVSGVCFDSRGQPFLLLVKDLPTGGQVGYTVHADSDPEGNGPGTLVFSYEEGLNKLPKEVRLGGR